MLRGGEVPGSIQTKKRFPQPLQLCNVVSSLFSPVQQKKPVLADDVDIDELAALSENYTGADLAGLVRQASLYALKESIASSTASSQITVNRSNFMNALANTKSSVSEQVRRGEIDEEFTKKKNEFLFNLLSIVAGQTSLREAAEIVYGDDARTGLVALK